MFLGANPKLPAESKVGKVNGVQRSNNIIIDYANSYVTGNILNINTSDVVCLLTGLDKSVLTPGIGAVVIGKWTNTGTNPGAESITIGYGTQPSVGGASATFSVAVGSDAQASGNNSIAIGVASVSTGTNSIAIGVNNTSYGAVSNNSIAIGGSALAQGTESISIGSTAQTAGYNYSVCLGSGTATSATYGLALGYGASTSASPAMAVGRSATAAKTGSAALGYYSSTFSSGELCFNGGLWSDGIDYHVGIMFQPFQLQTTNATPTEMQVPIGSATNSPGAYVILPTYSSSCFEMTIVGRVPGTTDRCVFTGTFMISKDANSASTVLDWNTGFTQKYATAALSGSSIAVTADTTNGRPAISITGVAATTIRWTGTAKITRSRTAT